MSLPNVFSVTLNWNRREDTLACLASLAASDYLNLQSILVDNASIDDTVPAVRSVFPQVTIIQNETNPGYATAINAGLRYALDHGADLVWIVDNDAVVAIDTLTALVEVAAREIAAAVLTPKILFYSQPDLIWSMGYDCRRLTLTRINSWESRLASSDDGQIRRTVYGPCCGLLVKREVFEDLDFCLRVRQAQYQMFAVPAAVVRHKVSASAGMGSPLQKYHLARSSVRFYHKHTAAILHPIIFFYRLGSAIRTTWQAIRHRRSEVVRAYWRGLRDGWRATFGPASQ